MKFQFDKNKSIANREKYGIDFDQAQALWDDLDLLEIPAKNIVDENRYLIIGKIGEKHWSAVIPWIPCAAWDPSESFLNTSNLYIHYNT